MAPATCSDTQTEDFLGKGEVSPACVNNSVSFSGKQSQVAVKRIHLLERAAKSCCIGGRNKNNYHIVKQSEKI